MNRDPLADAVRLAQAGNIADAARLCEQVLQQHPAHATALALAGALALHSGDVARALKRLSAAVGIDARNAGTQANLGDALSASGRHDDAIAAYRRAIAIEPRHAPAQAGLGIALQARGDTAGALAAFERAAALAPQSAPILTNLGAALQAAGRLDDALAALARACALAPFHPEPLYNTGVVLQAKGDLAGAERAYRDALAQAPQHVQALHNLGFVLAQQGKPAPALEFYERALALAPDFAEAQFNRANALKDLGRFGDAIAGYDQTLQIDPQHVRARFNRSISQLTLGNFKNGWRDYDRRWDLPGIQLPDLARRWAGEALRGKRILLIAEQGFGDAIQFSRFASLLAAGGAVVILQSRAEVFDLLKTVKGVDQVIPLGQALPSYDYWCPLLSVPFMLGTELKSIPSNVPYLRASRPIKREIQDLLSNRGSVFRIGFAWSSSKASTNDNRSTALGQFRSLAEIPGVQLVSLQKGPEAGLLHQDPLRSLVVDANEHLNDFADTAALIGELDLVISVDTALAHLSGALGRPTWILLPFSADWRWLIDTTKSPWYPTARLFRQPRPSAWEPVMDAVSAALKGTISAPHA